jgi:exodeoxyribonuclease-3
VSRLTAQQVPVRIITCNVNGIRSAARKGFFAWLAAQNADVVCLQEVKAQAAQLPPEALEVPGLRCELVEAGKKGYSGVALFSRRVPDAVTYGLDWPEIDAEARFLSVDFGELTVASLYVPSGTTGPVRQAFKEVFLERFLPYLAKWRTTRGKLVLCGDFNVAHREIDVFDPKGCARTTGFLPQERAWLDRVVELGWVDAFRVVNREPKQYTWWSNWPQAWPRNLGWRIDYQLVTPDLGDAVRGASIYRDERFSDHAPLTIDYDLDGT